MVVVYDRKVQERESVVLNFFNDVLLDLRFVKLFQDLRNCTNRWQDKKCKPLLYYANFDFGLMMFW